MAIPEDLSLTVEEISYLRNCQLAAITGVNASYFSAWTLRRQISERLLGTIAARMGLDKGDLLKALELKRQEAQKAAQIRAKADRLIQFLKQQQEVTA